MLECHELIQIHVTNYWQFMLTIPWVTKKLNLFHFQDEFKVPNSNIQQHHPIPNRPNNQPPTNHHQLLPTNNQQQQNNQNMVAYPSDKPPSRNNENNSTHQDVPPPLPTSPPPVEPSYQTVYSQKPQSMRNQRNEGYEKQVEPPAPPARKSSYEVTNQMSTGGNR